jgi:hypothetical protein
MDDYIIEFLLKNGFTEVNPTIFTNDKCEVEINLDDINEPYYKITLNYIPENDNTKGHIFSDDLCIYWLIGLLTYRGLIDKNYNQ